MTKMLWLPEGTSNPSIKTYEEVKRELGMVEVIHLTNLQDHVLLVDEEGRLKDTDINSRASAIMMLDRGSYTLIVGGAALARSVGSKFYSPSQPLVDLLFKKLLFMADSNKRVEPPTFS